MLYIYITLIVGLCSFEAFSQDGPVSPSKRPRGSHMVRSSVRSNNSRATAARKLFFEADQEREKQVHVPSCIMPKLKTDRLLPRLYKALNALNDLYAQDPVAYENLTCMFDEERYKQFINPQGQNNPDVIESRQKKWIAYMKKCNSVGLLDQSRPIVKFVYENSFVATTPSPRVDEQVNFIALAPALVKECSLPVSHSYNVPSQDTNHSLEIDQASYTDSISKLLSYKQKHPNRFKDVAALFNETKYNSLMQKYAARSKDKKSKWVSLLKSWHRNDLLTDDLRPIKSLEVGYEYITKQYLHNQ